MVTTRRDLLLGAAATSLATLWGCSTARTTPSAGPFDATATMATNAQTDFDVVVVGAGAAGTAAARAVQAAKRSVIVLEAMDRTGGRCYSYDTFPIPFDVGAQFVGQSASLNNFLYPLMRNLGVPLIAGEDVPRFFYNSNSGKNANANTFYETYASLDAALLAAGLAITLGAPDVSVLDVIQKAGLTRAPYLDLAVDFLVSAPVGGPVNQQSMLDLYNELQFIPAVFVFPPKDSFLVPSGYGAFLQRLTKGLLIRKNSPVASIDYSGARVIVRTADRRTYRAKAVIVTPSINVLKSGSITFAPDLPKTHVSALGHLDMGHAWKSMMEFTGRPFDVNHNVKRGKMFTAIPLVDGAAPQFFGNYFDQQFPGTNHTYLQSIAEEALGVNLERMGPQKAGQALCAMLEKPFPGITARWTGRIVASDWKANQYTLGCLSYAKTGHTNARVTLGKPLDNKVWFAGEALSLQSHDTVNGAWASGTAAGYSALLAMNALTRRR